MKVKNKSDRLHNKGLYHKGQCNATFFYTKGLSIQTNKRMATYLKDLAQSLGRYGGLLKIRFGFKFFLDAQVVSLLSADFLASKDGGANSCSSSSR